MVNLASVSTLFNALQLAMTKAPAFHGQATQQHIDQFFNQVNSAPFELTSANSEHRRSFWTRENRALSEGLVAAYNHASACGSPLSDVVAAFNDVEPELRWRRRPVSHLNGRAFHLGHANAHIVGPDGISTHPKVQIGATVLAPGVSYPKHNHPPAELYLVLSESEWFNEGSDWYAPGMGDVIYHPAGLSHAMRSLKTPLLAIWCLM